MSWISIDDEVAAIRFLLEHAGARRAGQPHRPGAGDQRRVHRRPLGHGAAPAGRAAGAPAFGPAPASLGAARWPSEMLFCQPAGPPPAGAATTAAGHRASPHPDGSTDRRVEAAGATGRLTPEHAEPRPASDGARRRRAAPGVAAFDFDGTLAREDTFVPFLRDGLRRPAHGAGGRRCARRAAPRPRRAEAGRAGHAVPGLARRPASTSMGAAYAATLAALLRPDDARAAALAPGPRATRSCIVSASLGTYLRPLAAEPGHRRRARRSSWWRRRRHADRRGRRRRQLPGRGQGGPAAGVARRHATAPAPTVELWAYGDSSGDEELLAAADHPTWVGQRASRNGDPVDHRRLRLPFRLPGR